MQTRREPALAAWAVLEVCRKRLVPATAAGALQATSSRLAPDPQHLTPRYRVIRANVSNGADRRGRTIRAARVTGRRKDGPGQDGVRRLSSG